MTRCPRSTPCPEPDPAGCGGNHAAGGAPYVYPCDAMSIPPVTAPAAEPVAPAGSRPPSGPSASAGSPAAQTPARLAARLADLLPEDERRLGRRLEGVRRIRADAARAAVLEEIATEIAAAQERVAAKRAAVPTITYPAELPVSQRRDDIARRDPRPPGRDRRRRDRLRQDHPAARRSAWSWAAASAGTIGHTQPRRIAARTVAERIAEELGTALGDDGRLQGALHRPGLRRRPWSS